MIPALSPVETWGTKSSRVWGKVKAEAKHYWLGTKLLWAEVRIAAKLCRQIANGHEMSRRERKQLLRTVADLVRMVPFVVILVVPFAEFALPVLLKFFPNMLPSTYLDSTGAEAKLQKQLLVKMEMARFLQETTHLLAQQLASQKGMSNEEAVRSAEKFRDFMDKVRTGKKVLNADIIGFSKLFDSELTLDNLDQRQLEAMCRLLDIKVFGSLWVLRYKLEEKLRRIQKDDELIQKDGIAALNYAELQEACRARGIYTDQDESYLRRKLADWLELSLEKEVPITLLLLSRAFSRQMTGAAHHGAPEADMAEDLASTLAYVPAVAIAEAEKEIVDRTDDKAAKLKVLQEEAVEAAFEELQMSKAGKGGQHRAAKLLSTKPAIGVTKEKLARLEERNDDVEEMIDETIAEDKEIEEKKKVGDKQAQAAAATATTAEGESKATASTSPSSTVPPTPSVSPSQQQVRGETVTLFDPSIASSTSTSTSSSVPVVSDAPLPPAADDVSVAASASASASKGVVDEEAAAAQKIAKKKKQIQVVDKLNDNIGKIIDEIKAQAESLEKEMEENNKEKK